VLRALDAALVAGLCACYLLWISGGDLTRDFPGGWLAALGLAAGLSAVLLVARLAFAGVFGCWWATLRARPANLVLAAILLAAAVPRLAPMPFLSVSPAAVAAERQALTEARRMLTTGNYRPQTFARPGALLYLQTALGAATFLVGVSSDRWREVHLVQAEDLAMPARLLNALFGLLSVVLVYIAGRALYSRRAGLLAAALLAFSPLAWHAAHLATEDALVALVGLGAFLAIVRLEPGPGDAEAGAATARYPTFGVAGAAFLVGLATGVRPALVLLAVPLTIALWKRGGSWRLVVLGAVAAFGAGFLVATPYAIAALPALLDAGASAAGEYALKVEVGTLALLVRHIPAGVGLLLRADPVLALAGGCGVLVAVARRRRGDWLLLAFLLPSALLFLLHRTFDVRQLFAYAPFLALLGGTALDEGWAAVGRPRRRSRRRAGGVLRRPKSPSGGHPASPAGGASLETGVSLRTRAGARRP
jgi:hypothetical protein